MIRALLWLLLATGTATTAAAAPERPAMADARCTAVRILPDGRPVAAAMPPGVSGDSGISAGRGSGAAWASSRASGRSSSASSSSSSASSSGGASFAQSTASHTDELGRTITIIRDGRGCRVTIDERTTGEE